MRINRKQWERQLSEKRWTQKELSARSGVSSRTLAKIAKGEDLRSSVVERLAFVLGVTAADLVQRNVILETLDRERRLKLPGGLYHETQVRLTYNSNHIEGSRLTEEQTRYLFETATLGALPADVPFDDVLETNNHFRCVDHIIATATEPLTERYLLDLHAMLKAGTNFAATYGAGKYKSYPNTVGGIETTPPEKVAQEITALLKEYAPEKSATFKQIVSFHYHFECIHPFQDGNGRIGRLILFKECLKNGFIPSYVDDKYKQPYYHALQEWKSEHGYLVETFRFGQDLYKMLLDYFRIDYEE